MPNHGSAHCGTWRVLPEGMSQMFRLLYLGNGWADCVEIWHALGDPLVTAYAVVTGGVSESESFIRILHMVGFTNSVIVSTRVKT